MISEEKKAEKACVFGQFRVEGTSFASGSRMLGWRITSTDQIAGLVHEYWVRDGQIFHVQPQTLPPWSQLDRFIVGLKVQRLNPSEKEALQKAIEVWSR